MTGSQQPPPQAYKSDTQKVLVLHFNFERRCAAADGVESKIDAMIEWLLHLERHPNKTGRSILV